MKLAEIKKETTCIIAEHIAEGWTLDWDDATRGNKVTQFFSKGNEVRCLTVKEESGYGETLEKFIIRLFSIDKWWSDICGGFSWSSEDETDIDMKIFWKVDEDWYIENEEEANGIFKKKRDRRRRSFEPFKEEKSLAPSEALIEIMKTVEGFEKATQKNIRVVKRTVRNLWGRKKSSYYITMLNRVGNVKVEKSYPLGR